MTEPNIGRNGGEFNAFDLHEFHFELKKKMYLWNIFVANISCISKSQQLMNFPFWFKSFLEHTEKDIMIKPKQQPHGAAGGSLA